MRGLVNRAPTTVGGPRLYHGGVIRFLSAKIRTTTKFARFTLPTEYVILAEKFYMRSGCAWRNLSVKITCKQQDLSRGLSVVSHAVSSRSTLPILANILLATDHGRLKLSATNLEIGINCWIDAEVHEEGSTTVPAKVFTELVNSLPQAPVDIAVPRDSNIARVKITGGSGEGIEPGTFTVEATAEDLGHNVSTINAAIDGPDQQIIF